MSETAAPEQLPAKIIFQAEDLITALKAIETFINEPDLHKTYVTDAGFIAGELYHSPPVDYLGGRPHDEQDKLAALVSHAVFVANELLIQEDGQVNLTNLQTIRLMGCPIHKGESDSFGWLSGVILAKHFKLVFG